jgi:hypothetical protein
VTGRGRVRRPDATAWICQLAGRGRKNEWVEVLSTACVCRSSCWLLQLFCQRVIRLSGVGGKFGSAPRALTGKEVDYIIIHRIELCRGHPDGDGELTIVPKLHYFPPSLLRTDTNERSASRACTRINVKWDRGFP